MWKEFASSYLNFSKKERKSIFILLTLILLIFLLPFTYPLFIKKSSFDHSKLEEDIAKLTIKQADSYTAFKDSEYDESRYQTYNQTSNTNYNPVQKSALFYFDPNTLSEEGWRKLGVKEKTIETIKKYTSKGGKFYKPEDIGKIWGLNESLVTRLIPYVKIESGFTNSSKEYPKEQNSYNNKSANKETKQPIDINTADTSAFISLPGIGSKLSQRIILFREKLGGFYKIEQVAETFGLPDSTFQKIKPRLVLNEATPIKQININTATIEEMKIHPYLKYTVANAIIQYRVQHGDYNSVDDIKKIMTIDTELFNKIVPYLKVN